MTNAVPDKFDPMEEVPRTIQGMLQEMNDIMQGQLEETDRLTVFMSSWDKMQERAHPGKRDADFVMAHAISTLVLKLQTQVSLQSLCLERMYHELRPRE